MRTENRQYPGVYAKGADGAERLVHLYQGGFYKLADINEIFGLGTVEAGESEEENVLVLNRHELRMLKVGADAYSFDYDERFIEMCLEMHRFAATVPGETVRFVANFVGEYD